MFCSFSQHYPGCADPCVYKILYEVIGMDSDELRAMIESNAKKAGEYLNQLRDDLLTVDEYVDKVGEIDLSELGYAKTFSDQTEFEEYMQERHAPEAAGDISYVSEQLETMKKYGIETITFGVFEADDDSHMVFLCDHVNENCRDWDKETMIEYTEELLGDDDSSPTDRTALGKQQPE
jgi:hypothetical protein